jgi:hypothetical protein
VYSRCALCCLLDNRRKILTCTSTEVHYTDMFKRNLATNKQTNTHTNICDYETLRTRWGEPGSSFNIASDYGLDGRGSIPTEAEDFSSSLCVQTGSGAHPASCTMGAGGSFPGGKARPGRDADNSPPSRAKGKKTGVPLTQSASLACSGTTFYLFRILGEKFKKTYSRERTNKHN